MSNLQDYFVLVRGCQVSKLDFLDSERTQLQNFEHKGNSFSDFLFKCQPVQLPVLQVLVAYLCETTNTPLRHIFPHHCLLRVFDFIFNILIQTQCSCDSSEN